MRYFYFRKMALLLICVALLSSCKLLSELAPVKEDLSKVHDWIVVPVFYATTRQRAKSKTIDFLEVGAEKGLMFGVKNVAVPAPEKVTVSDETMKKMGWQIVHVDKPLKEGQRPDLPAIEQLAIWDQEYGSNEIVSNFDKYRQRCGKKEVVIFVHGCCATFQTSLERAAKLASHMQMPIVVFDWDSPKGFTKYLANETTAEQSLDDFYAFLVNAEKSIQPGDTILLGHSMGARFLNDAMVRRSERARFNIPYQKYGELILSQPDIDARSYINHNGDIVGQAELTRIYFNTTDGRLDASATAHGDFERLGRPEKFLDTLCSVDGQEMIDITECAMGHEIPFWVVGDLTNHLDTAPGGLACKQVGKGHYVLQKITP